MGGMKKNTLPSYSELRGSYVGGDTRTLYAFTDSLTGRTIVRPGGGSRGNVTGGPGGGPCTVAIATREQAIALWQSDLSAGWVVA